MLKLRNGIVELYRKVATSLPPDVDESIKTACGAEPDGSEARAALEGISQKVKESRKNAALVCLEIGVPVFYVSVPQGLSHKDIMETILEATRVATAKIPLGASAVDILTERNTGDNTGKGFPIINIEQSPTDVLTIDLTLRCPECETQGQTYALPNEALNAGTNLDGIAKCVLDAVRRAGGNGCPPYVVGIGAGASKDQVTALSRRQIMRKLTDKPEETALADFETNLLKEINGMGIGARGTTGSNIALAVKAGLNHRLTSSFVVDVYLSCWALRRGRLVW